MTSQLLLVFRAAVPSFLTPISTLEDFLSGPIQDCSKIVLILISDLYRCIPINLMVFIPSYGSFSFSPVSEGSAWKLIADEVGLGKTAIVVSTIAFLSHATTLQLQNKPLPPILSELICIETVELAW